MCLSFRILIIRINGTVGLRAKFKPAYIKYGAQQKGSLYPAFPLTQKTSFFEFAERLGTRLTERYSKTSKDCIPDVTSRSNRNLARGNQNYFAYVMLKLSIEQWKGKLSGNMKVSRSRVLPSQGQELCLGSG